MRKLILGASVAIAVSGLGPISGASADIAFKGNCTVYGNATFQDSSGNPSGLTGQPQTMGYSFVSGVPTGSNPLDPPDANPQTNCTGVTLNGSSVPDGPATVSVKAVNQTLSCEFSSSTDSSGNTTDGDGTITLANGVAVPFKLEIMGVATEVNLTVKGPTAGSASGHASFAQYSDSNTPSECNGPPGVQKLGFKATFDNTGGNPLVGPGSYGQSGGGGSSGSGGSGGSTGSGSSPGAGPSGGSTASVASSGGGGTHRDVLKRAKTKCKKAKKGKKKKAKSTCKKAKKHKKAKKKHRK
ncbi:MAG: hypothetical protein E6G56_13550 [Actinobacteria bacterium]|nr:MAG: hypothetical protein E6G56_13550 [Actinomycetota bacterium]